MKPKDEIGDRMKRYEMAEAGRYLMPLAPVMARLDGEAFHTFCRGLDKPFDERLSGLMQATARFLLELTNACIVYTQSDEISLAWHREDYAGTMFFIARVTKIVSHLAGKASGYFNRHLPEYLPDKADGTPSFDCRVWNVPNRVEAANTFLWREMDATRNSIAAAAQVLYPHRKLINKGRDELLGLLLDKGIDWNDYPTFFKRGTFFQRRTVRRRFTADGISELPPKHMARIEPDLMVERRVIQQVGMPSFRNATNRVEVIFEEADPIMEVEA